MAAAVPARISQLRATVAAARDCAPNDSAVEAAAAEVDRLTSVRVGGWLLPVTAEDCARWSGDPALWSRAQSAWSCRQWEQDVSAATYQLAAAMSDYQARTGSPCAAGVAETAEAAADQAKGVVEELDSIPPSSSNVEIPAWVKVAVGLIVASQVAQLLRS